MNLFDKYKLIGEASGSKLYDSGVGYTARVISKGDTHVAKFFKDGVHMKDADYTHKDLSDVHEFAQDEMEHRKNANKKSVDERILEPQGHLESADHITDDSETGKGPKKKMMGNRTPLDIIAKILAGR